MESFHPGDEYELVDEYARRLKLRAWYDWRPDTGRFNASAADNDLDAPSAFLTSDKPEVYTFCLDALRRFEGKDRDHIFTVVSEIGILGMGGIDHKTQGKTYTLKAYPSETFSGLHLLCLMYVGFRIIEPATNTGLDFSEAYKMALEAHRAMVH
jgi:hypothetical protein